MNIDYINDHRCVFVVVDIFGDVSGIKTCQAQGHLKVSSRTTHHMSNEKARFFHLHHKPTINPFMFIA
jgi:uncharacterized protein YuzE